MKFDVTLKDLSAEQVVAVSNWWNNWQGEQKALVGSTVGIVPAATLAQGVTVADDRPAFVKNEETEEIAAVEGQLDSAGFPWDGRIHAETKKLTAKGIWKKRRGVDEATISAVEAEIRSSGNAPVVQFAVPQAMTAPVGAAYPFPAAHVPAQIQPASTPAAVQYSPAPVAPTVPANDFNGLMAKMATLHSTGQVNPEWMAWFQQTIGANFNVQVSSIVDIANRPDMVNYAWQVLAQQGK